MWYYNLVGDVSIANELSRLEHYARNTLTLTDGNTNQINLLTTLQPNQTVTIPILRCKGFSAWTPVENNYYNYLTFDLGDQRMIRTVSTLGRGNTKEFVTEYVIQYSDDGEQWRSYANSDGEDQVTQH